MVHLEQVMDSTSGNIIAEMPTFHTNSSATANASDHPTYNTNYSSFYNDSWEDWVSASAANPSVHDIFLSNLQRQMATCGVVLTVITFITNSIVINACWKYSNTRDDTFYSQIANFSISNLLVSLFVLPFTVYYIMHPWELGQTMCKIWIVMDIMLPFASMTILLILNIDRILAITHPGPYNYLYQKCSSHITFTPWIVALVIVVPIWSFGTIPYKDIPGECIVIVHTDAALLCHILTFFIPFIILVFLTIHLLVLRLKRRPVLPRTQSTEEFSLQDQSNTCTHTSTEVGYTAHEVSVRLGSSRSRKQVPTCSIASVCVVNFLFAGMWFPFQCFSILLTTCNSQRCVPSIEVNQAVTWMGTASAAVIPAFWLIDDKLRQNIKTMFFCGAKTSRKPNRTNSEETFL